MAREPAPAAEAPGAARRLLREGAAQRPARRDRPADARLRGDARLPRAPPARRRLRDSRPLPRPAHERADARDDRDLAVREDRGARPGRASTPDQYEAVLAPIYALVYSAVQGRPTTGAPARERRVGADVGRDASGQRRPGRAAARGRAASRPDARRPQGCSTPPGSARSAPR